MTRGVNCELVCESQCELFLNLAKNIKKNMHIAPNWARNKINRSRILYLCTYKNVYTHREQKSTSDNIYDCVFTSQPENVKYNLISVDLTRIRSQLLSAQLPKVVSQSLQGYMIMSPSCRIYLSILTEPRHVYTLLISKCLFILL